MARKLSFGAKNVKKKKHNAQRTQTAAREMNAKKTRETQDKATKRKVTVDGKARKKKIVSLSHPDQKLRNRQRFTERYRCNAHFRNEWRNKMQSKYAEHHFRIDWRKKMKNKYKDAAFQKVWKEKMRKRYEASDDFRNEWKEKMRQRYEAEDFRNEWRGRSKKRFREKYQDDKFKKEWKDKMRRRYTDSAFQREWKERMRKRYMDVAFQTAWKDKMRRRYMDVAFQAVWKEKMREKHATNAAMINAQRQEKYRNDKQMQDKQKVRQQNNSIKKKTDTSTTAAIARFTSNIQQGPVCTCISCHRHMYRKSVVGFVATKYHKMSRELIQKMIDIYQVRATVSDKQFVCKTCHSHLVRGELPVQAAVN